MLQANDLFSPIRCIISDIDGVLTDGAIIITDEYQEIKTFHVQDGLGIRLLLENSIQFAVISSRESPAVLARMSNLGVDAVYQGYSQKLPALQDILTNLRLAPEQVAYVGDDWPDIAVMQRVGLPIAVANATPEVKRYAKLITTATGGTGAMREIAIALLQSQNLYEKALAKFIAYDH